MTVKNILILLIIVAICSFAKEKIVFATGDDVKTKFGPSRDTLSYEDLRDKMSFFVGNQAFRWNKEGIYVEMDKWDLTQEFSGDGSFAAFLPANTTSMVMYYIPLVPCEGGSGMGKCRKCLKNSILKNNKSILKKCRKDVQISDSLNLLINKFFAEERMSLVDCTKGFDTFYSKRGEYCYSNLFMFSQDESGKRKFFDMVPPGCIDNEMKKNKIIDEYIYLYDQFYSIFHNNFKGCRWENFGDKKQLDKCLSY